MTNLSYQRRLAAKVLKCGKDRVYFDPENLERIEMAVTREDIKRLVHDGVIKRKPVKGVSRARVRAKSKKRRGAGSFKGTFNARYPKKRRWINRIRPLRKLLRHLRDSKRIDRHTYRYFYNRLHLFRSRSHLLKHLIHEKLLKGEELV